MLNKIIRSSYQERVDNPWITSFRKTMIPIAAVKILWIIEHLHIKEVYVSPFSLKEGALFYGI